MSEKALPPCMISIDKEGRWYHKGMEMIHREFIRLFYQQLERDSSGRYIIEWQGERCYVEVEDTPFVVWRVTFKKEGSKKISSILLNLSDDTWEALSPDTLFVGEGHVLYCTVKKGIHQARFNRPSYYQLADIIEEEKGRYYLPLDDKKYFIS